MRNFIFLLLFLGSICNAQQSDFAHINFEKADLIARKTRSRKLYALNELTLKLTKDLDTDVEKVRAIYKWICINVASDFRLYYKNKRLRKKYKNDSVKLAEWNSELKRDLFEKLLKRKKTICTGYAYLFKTMCDVIDIENKMVYGFGRTADITEFDINYPNHTWNAIKLNNKWYLCDATWAAGIAYEDRFNFDYNDGYFLTQPGLFIYNHYPIEREFSLLGEQTPTFEQFVQMPLLYGKAYEVLEKHEAPIKMQQNVKKGESINLQYQLKKSIDQSDLKLIAFNGYSDKQLSPEVSIQNNKLSLKNQFNKSGYFDVHLYLKNELVATYLVNVVE